MNQKWHLDGWGINKNHDKVCVSLIYDVMICDYSVQESFKYSLNTKILIYEMHH